MKIAIMQPYFFPYIGYFQLINAVDRFIIGNQVQYIYQGWINRNRVLKPGPEGWMYITVPVPKHKFSTLISDMKTVEGDEWKNKIIHQFDHYKKKAPFYKDTCGLLKECFATSETDITRLNATCIKAVCDYIGIDYKVEIQSEMVFDYSEVTDREDRPIKICRQLGGTVYINPPGGKELYHKDRFSAGNIQLSFIEPTIKEYDQYRGYFEPGLSILDVMMFNSPGDIKLMVNDYQLS